MNPAASGIVSAHWPKRLRLASFLLADRTPEHVTRKDYETVFDSTWVRMPTVSGTGAGAVSAGL